MHASVLLLLALAAQTAVLVHGGGAAIESKDVRVTLVPEKTTTFLGEPISAGLMVKNVSAGPLQLQNTEDFDLGQLIASQQTIQLMAVDEKGGAAPPPAWRRPSEWRIRSLSPLWRDLPPGGSTVLRFDIAPLVAFEHPGTYTLTATATLVVSGENRDWAHLPVKASATIEVLPPDPERMGRLIDELEKKSTLEPFVRIDEDRQQEEVARSEAVRKLSYLADERVIPFYRRQMRHAERYGDMTAALEALSKFSNDAALDSLRDGLEITEIVGQSSPKPDPDYLGRVHIAAAKSLLYSPHPGALPLLLSHYGDPDPQVRCIVIEALNSGRVPPTEATPVLRRMAKDKTDFVADRAREALKNPVTKPAR